MAKTVLVAVLNWGLGHAMRMLPIVGHIRQMGYQVVLASDGAAGKVLQQQFPHLPYHELPGYGASYPRQGPAWWGVLCQTPRLLYTMQQEQKATQHLVAEYSPSFILSDNRYGCHHHGVPSFFITHQLQPIVPVAFSPFQTIVSLRFSKWMRPFERIWVPDVPEVELAGRLSQPLAKDEHRVDYLGWLSGLPQVTPTSSFEWLVIISGPEPSRSSFEQQVWQSIEGFSSFRMVGGNVQGGTTTDERMLPYANPPAMAALYQGASRILARAGYSTLMDLMRWQKQALLVPTPGQTEQLYVAGRCAANKWMPMVPQPSISPALRHQTFEGYVLPRLPDDAFTRYQTILHRYLG